MKIPLAWLQLSHEKARFLIALAGIGFADILMFIQLGFKEALFDSSVVLHEQLAGDIFLINPQSDASIALQSFSRRRLNQSLGVRGVESVSPMYLDFAVWKNPINGKTRTLMVIAFNPQDNVINLPEVQNQSDEIELPDVVLFDALSRVEFGPIPELMAKGEPVFTEVKSRRVRIGGLFEIGASFGADGNIITSDLNFFRLFPERNPNLIDFGVIKLEPDADLEAVLANLRVKLPNDVEVLSREEFIEYEKSYWRDSTAIGFIFNLGVSIGFIVGTVIVYQILYTNVNEHLPEYATLKAMGYKDKYFVVLVFQQALILAILGYIPGFVVTNLLYNLALNATNLPILMSLNKAFTILILTIIMCCCSGAIAMRKLSAADPADIF